MELNSPLHFEMGVKSGIGLFKLVLFTIILTLFSIPIASLVTNSVDFSVLASSGDSHVLQWIFTLLGVEGFFLTIIVLPPAFGFMGLLYSTTKVSFQKKIENAGWGYIAGFLIGLTLILMIFGGYGSGVASIIATALVGFAAGIFLSFVSSRQSRKVTIS
jgi:hypothetical protein